MPPRPEAPDGHVVIGELGRPHGVLGELRAYPTGPTLAELRVGALVAARTRTGQDVRLTLSGRRDGGDALLASFREVTTRDAAVPLVGAVLHVPVADLPRIDDPDEFYVRDLIGYSVALAPGGRALGAVTRVHAGAANDVLEVGTADGGHVLVPFTHDAIVQLDRTARTMAVREDLFGGGEA